ncbi:hypothetical protein HYH02_009299 [Chlamydomonas schloesseri]|uniref:Uncharacterized protein n=1 Tax=Chlamydomonas schloesseri TaxID=2026947 RepID=A0A835TPZ7_9CHLO|nr:hypothetical protein HYH02_009299 [Chlamydomonas schloesseri]|eukprot:KAG2443226.1 hypothetical protein HYH02_009299 [Chlamydomonas schloesseri]
MSAWFHDAIYEPQRHDNERRSAELAVEMLSRRAPGGDLAPDRLQTLVALIMATVRHQLPEAQDLELAAALVAAAGAGADGGGGAGAAGTEGAPAAAPAGAARPPAAHDAKTAAAVGVAPSLSPPPALQPQPQLPPREPGPDGAAAAAGDTERLRRLRHDAALLLDADLSALGGCPAAYAAYAAGIRAEYLPHYGATAYAAGRCRVLRSFLQCPALYFTARGAEAHEAPARANLAAELVELEAQASSAAAEGGDDSGVSASR